MWNCMPYESEMFILGAFSGLIAMGALIYFLRP